jgi:nitrogenase molybdenum-iron protein NifN
MIASTNPNAVTRNYASSCNACRQCTPLGACLAFKGVEGSVPYLHGSQGCATYIRRYLISHFREPMDIASSSFSEEAAIFGGERNFIQGIENVMRQYRPKIIGIATTCLSETIGDDVPGFLRLLNEKVRGVKDPPRFVHVSTPSYTGSHIDGFHETVRALVASAPGNVPLNDRVGVFPGMVSPEDLRFLRDVFADFGLKPVLVPDYSDTLDGPAWAEYHEMAPGGTTLAEIDLLPGAMAAVDFTRCVPSKKMAGDFLHTEHGLYHSRLAPPIGIAATDAWMKWMSDITGHNVPERYTRERGRLVDALVDGHKYLSGVRVAVYGESDLALSLAVICSEFGMKVDLLAVGGMSPDFPAIAQNTLPLRDCPRILNGADFRDIEDAIEADPPDLLLGHSKGYALARRIGLPLVRAGFPIHDRFGGQRILHLGYAGAQRLLDTLINTLLDHRQTESPVGWSYL